MKVLNLRNGSNRLKKLIKSIDLLDGQRRGEVIFRRFFVLAVGFALVYLALLLFVGKKEDIQEVRAQEVVVEEVVKAEPVVYESARNTVEDSVSRFIASYGGRIDSEYLGYLRIYCNDETLKKVVAISVAETSMGKATNKKTNFYGWYPKGNRQFDLESKEEMSKVICTGISKYYEGVGQDNRLADRYTGGDRTSTWMKNFNWALSKMK